MAPPLVLLLALILAAGCGEEEPAVAPTGTQLVVRLDRDGPRGPMAPEELRVDCAAGDASPACRAAERLEPRDFYPVPDNVACTDIFGGPETARITGTLRGERVSATFSRSNGCEIHRWDTVAPLLGQVR
jgi:hypothetical protein